MKIVKTPIPDLLIVEPTVFDDERGYFYESFNQRRFIDLSGIDSATRFVQDNHCRSARYVLRGLHYQIKQSQGKLVRVVAGEIFDVAVDIRKSSPTFGKWFGLLLSAENRRQLWTPQGFAHGFAVTSDSAEVVYKNTDYWAPEHERTILWNDPAIGIDWPLEANPLLSGKDQNAKPLAESEIFE